MHKTTLVIIRLFAKAQATAKYYKSIEIFTVPANLHKTDNY